MSFLTEVQASSTVERELAIEQAHVDLVYARLAEATRSAQSLAQAGRDLFRSDRESYLREEDGTGLYERDVFAFQAAKRLAVLDAEHEGLVFGRLDRTDGEVRYVGRIGVRDAEYEPLVVDWRAPAAEPFYRATPSEPMQVVRRRVLRCQGDRVVGIEDDLLDAENARGDPRALPGLHHDQRRTWHRQDGGRAAPGRVPALLQPAALRVGRSTRGRAEQRVHELHRAGAALPRRGSRHPAADRRGGRRRGAAPRRT